MSSKSAVPVSPEKVMSEPPEENRGRSATSPSEIPARGWRDIAWRVVDAIQKDQLSIIAAGVAFYMMLAIFPAIGVLVSLYGLFFDPAQISGQISAFAGLLPKEAMEVLISQLSQIASQDNATLRLTAVTALLMTFWSASQGIRTLMQALNVAYGEDEKRGTIRFYATALVITLGGVLSAMVALAILVAMPTVGELLGSPFDSLLSYARWPILVIGMLLALTVVYRFGPSRRKPRWAWVSWGAGVATGLWIIGTAVFSYYVENFGSYNKTYGSAGALIILLLWFLLTAYVVLIGAEINAEMERQTARDTTTGRPKPLGERGAYAANTVGPTPPPKMGH